jgi:hypothetical protein
MSECHSYSANPYCKYLLMTSSLTATGAGLALFVPPD